MILAHKIGFWAVIGVASVAVVAVTYRQYSDLVDSKAQLSAKVASLGKDLATETARANAYERSLDSWALASAKQAQALEDNTRAQQEASKYSREITDALSKHNLGALASRKPGLIERRINVGTARAFSLLEQSTQPPSSRASDSASGSSSPQP